MTYQEKISFLRRYREAVRQEDTILQEIEELRTQAARVTQALTGMPGSEHPFALAKNKEGRTGDFNIAFDKEKQRFLEVVT